MKTLSLLFFALLTIVGFSSKKTLTIIPGKGYEDIHMGSDIDEVIKLIGDPMSESTREEEAEVWESWGYDIQKRFTFTFDFDKVYQFENDNKYALWKIFTKHGKIVFFNVSSHIYEKKITENIDVQSTLKFYDDTVVMKNLLGNNYVRNLLRDDDEEYVYFELGIRFIFSDEELRNIYIFNPIPDADVKQEIIDRLGWK